MIFLAKGGAIVGIGKETTLNQHGGAGKTIKQKNARIGSFDLAGIVLLQLCLYGGLNALR